MSPKALGLSFGIRNKYTTPKLNFHDYISRASFGIRNKYTTPKPEAIYGSGENRFGIRNKYTTPKLLIQCNIAN